MERTAGVFTRRHRPEKIFHNVLHQEEQLHVLAVDDSLVDRKVIERLLKISSCKVTVVDSGWSALQYLGLDGEQNSSVSLDGLKVNLIITDYWMPGMTGYELLKKIKESSALKEIPVVIMSSENVLPRINRCLEEGAEEFIVKPVKLSDVKRLKDYYTSKEEEPEPELVQAEKEEPELEEPELVEVVEEKETNNKRKLQDTEFEMEQLVEEEGEKVRIGTDVCISGSTSPSSTLFTSSGSSSPLTSGTLSPSDSPSRRLKTSKGTD